jgi:hypothetical protein
MWGYSPRSRGPQPVGDLQLCIEAITSILPIFFTREERGRKSQRSDPERQASTPGAGEGTSAADQDPQVLCHLPLPGISWHRNVANSTQPTLWHTHLTTH